MSISAGILLALCQKWRNLMRSKTGFIHLVAIAIFIYILLEIFSRVLFFWIPNDLQNLKILRDSFSVIMFLFLLKKYNYISSSDLKLNGKVIAIFGAALTLFIYFFTEQAQSSYPLYHIFSAVLISPIVEEIICRKFIYDFLATHTNTFIAVIVSSLIFVLLHFSTNLSMNIFYLCMSIIFTVARFLSGSVTNSIILHFISNLTMAIR